jgi:hypothetical protein
MIRVTEARRKMKSQPPKRIFKSEGKALLICPPGHLVLGAAANRNG